MKILKVAAGLILIATGIFCFVNPGETFLSIAFLLGCAMLAAGIIGTFIYFWISRKKAISGFLLAEGIWSILLGILVLSNQLLAEVAIPVFFGLWILISGIARVTEAYSNRHSDWKIIVWLVFPGVICIAAGLYAFFNTILFGFSVILLTGILFLIRGIDVVLLGVHLPSKTNRRKAKHT